MAEMSIDYISHVGTLSKNCKLQSQNLHCRLRENADGLQS